MTIDVWQAQIKEAAARSGKLVVRGSGSKAFCAPPASADSVVLDTRAHAGIVEYEPNEEMDRKYCGKNENTQKRYRLLISNLSEYLQQRQ